MAVEHSAHGRTQVSDCPVSVKHSTQMLGRINIARGSHEGLTTMRKIIGAALIVLSLAGCSPGNLLGDSDWSRGYFKVADKEQRAN